MSQSKATCLKLTSVLGAGQKLRWKNAWNLISSARKVTKFAFSPQWQPTWPLPSGQPHEVQTFVQRNSVYIGVGRRWIISQKREMSWKFPGLWQGTRLSLYALSWHRPCPYNFDFFLLNIWEVSKLIFWLILYLIDLSVIQFIDAFFCGLKVPTNCYVEIYKARRQLVVLSPPRQTKYEAVLQCTRELARLLVESDARLCLLFFHLSRAIEARCCSFEVSHLKKKWNCLLSKNIAHLRAKFSSNEVPLFHLGNGGHPTLDN